MKKTAAEMKAFRVVRFDINEDSDMDSDDENEVRTVRQHTHSQSPRSGNVLVSRNKRKTKSSVESQRKSSLSCRFKNRVLPPKTTRTKCIP